MRVRPPALDAGYPDLAMHPPVGLDPQRCVRRAGERLDLRWQDPAPQPRRDRQDPVVSLDARAQHDVINNNPRPSHQPHRPPRPHDRRPGGEARGAAEDRRAHEAQRAAVLHHLGPPALARAPRLLREHLAQRPAADLKVIAFFAQQRADIHNMRREHRGPLRDHDAVEHHLEDRRDAIQREQHLLALGRWRRREAQPKGHRGVIRQRPVGHKAVEPLNLQAVLLRPARHPTRRSPAPTRRRGSR